MAGIGRHGLSISSLLLALLAGCSDSPQETASVDSMQQQPATDSGDQPTTSADQDEGSSDSDTTVSVLQERNYPVRVEAMYRLFCIKAANRGAVQSELNFTSEQIESVQSMQSYAKELLGKARDLSAADRKEVFDSEVLPATLEMERTLRETLDKQQYERLGQIVLRTDQKGPGVFLVPRVSEALELSEEQCEQIARIVVEVEDLAANVGGNVFRLVKLARLASQARGRALDTLTDSQRQRWRELCGEP